MSSTFHGYSQLSRAWYGDSHISDEDYSDCFNVGAYSEDGGCKYEFSILIDDGVKDSAHVVVYDDSFEAFTDMHGLFLELSKTGRFPSAENIKDILDGLGFRDITRTEMPE